jgi:hypothetical protein
MGIGPALTAADIERIAIEAAARFIRAYAP